MRLHRSVFLASILLAALVGCRQRSEAPRSVSPVVDTSLVVPSGVDSLRTFQVMEHSGCLFRYKSHFFPPRELVGFYDSVFAAHGMVESAAYGVRSTRLYGEIPRTGVTWCKVWKHPTEPVTIELALTRWGLEQAVQVNLDKSVPKAPDQVERERLDSLDRSKQLAAMETRLAAWGPRPGRKARLIIDLFSKEENGPHRTILRWADDGSIQILSRYGSCSPPKDPGKARLWADSLERLLSREKGRRVLEWDGISGRVGDVIVYAPKGSGWDGFSGLTDLPTRLHEADTALRRKLEANLGNPESVDSAMAATRLFLEAVGER